jgi:Predicted membrane protein
MNKPTDSTSAPAGIRDWLFRFVKGVVIALGFILPGVSGGVLAAILGIYTRILAFMANITRDFVKNVLFFIPVGLGGIAGIILLSAPLEYLLENFETVVMWCFAGCIAGTLPALYKEAGKEGRGKGDWAVFAVTFVVGFAALLALAVFEARSTDELPDGANISIVEASVDADATAASDGAAAVAVGILEMLPAEIEVADAEVADATTTASAASSTTSSGLLPTDRFTTWVIAGALIALGIIVPGLSPSNLLIVLGIFKAMIAGFKNADLMVFLPLALGGLVTLLLFSKIMERILRLHYSKLYHFILGIVIASTLLIVIPPVISYEGFTIASGAISAVLFALGCLLGSWMSRLEDKYKGPAQR